jgi:hypothetical protein
MQAITQALTSLIEDADLDWPDLGIVLAGTRAAPGTQPLCGS